MHLMTRAHVGYGMGVEVAPKMDMLKRAAPSNGAHVQLGSRVESAKQWNMLQDLGKVRAKQALG